MAGKGARRAAEDDGYRRRRAWDRAKAAFGSDDAAEQLTRLERSGHGCPRVLLAACAHHFLRLAAAEKRAVVRAYLTSLAFPAAELIPSRERSVEEVAETEAAFLAAMDRVYAEDAR